MEGDKNKFYLTANIHIDEVTDDIKREAAAVIELPVVTEQQPDLGYFSAVLVSTGTNLNGAHFLGSELIAAANTIPSKALDVEHVENEIIGHIYSAAFANEDHEPLDVLEMASFEKAYLDTKSMHIHVGCVIYKDRFSDLHADIKDNKYAVSMECYYKDFDVKVGNTIIPKESAAAAGIDINDNSIYGKQAKVLKDGKETASGSLARVLRGICFSGVGIVENPANPASVIVEVASTNDTDLVIEIVEKNEPEEKVINVTSKTIEQSVNTTDFSNATNDDNSEEDFNHDQEKILSSIESLACKYVNSLVTSKRSYEEGNLKLDRLRNVIDKASRTI